jgi:hypothetical protein
VRVYCQGEEHLEEALADRVAAVKRAGGIRAMKALMRMKSRAPLLPPNPTLLARLPPPEGL